MKTAELRLGNTIGWAHEESISSKIVTLEILEDLVYEETYPDDPEDRFPRGIWFVPIDLTTELLLHYGFRQLDKYTFVKGNFFVYKRKRGFITGSKRREIKLDSVHKLQNVYYANTDLELFI